jgi:hypothetical protein
MNIPFAKQMIKIMKNQTEKKKLKITDASFNEGLSKGNGMSFGRYKAYTTERKSPQKSHSNRVFRERKRE